MCNDDVHTQHSNDTRNDYNGNTGQEWSDAISNDYTEGFENECC